MAHLLNGALIYECGTFPEWRLRGSWCPISLLLFAPLRTPPFFSDCRNSEHKKVWHYWRNRRKRPRSLSVVGSQQGLPSSPCGRWRGAPPHRLRTPPSLLCFLRVRFCGFVCLFLFGGSFLFSVFVFRLLLFCRGRACVFVSFLFWGVLACFYFRWSSRMTIRTECR